MDQADDFLDDFFPELHNSSPYIQGHSSNIDYEIQNSQAPHTNGNSNSIHMNGNHHVREKSAITNGHKSTASEISKEIMNLTMKNSELINKNRKQEEIIRDSEKNLLDKSSLLYFAEKKLDNANKDLSESEKERSELKIKIDHLEAQVYQYKKLHEVNEKDENKLEELKKEISAKENLEQKLKNDISKYSAKLENKNEALKTFQKKLKKVLKIVGKNSTALTEKGSLSNFDITFLRQEGIDVIKSEDMEVMDISERSDTNKSSFPTPRLSECGPSNAVSGIIYPVQNNYAFERTEKIEQLCSTDMTESSVQSCKLLAPPALVAKPIPSTPPHQHLKLRNSNYFMRSVQDVVDDPFIFSDAHSKERSEVTVWCQQFREPVAISPIPNTPPPKNSILPSSDPCDKNVSKFTVPSLIKSVSSKRLSFSEDIPSLRNEPDGLEQTSVPIIQLTPSRRNGQSSKTPVVNQTSEKYPTNSPNKRLPIQHQESEGFDMHNGNQPEPSQPNISNQIFQENPNLLNANMWLKNRMIGGALFLSYSADNSFDLYINSKIHRPEVSIVVHDISIPKECPSNQLLSIVPCDTNFSSACNHSKVEKEVSQISNKHPQNKIPTSKHKDATPESPILKTTKFTNHSSRGNLNSFAPLPNFGVFQPISEDIEREENICSSFQKSAMDYNNHQSHVNDASSSIEVMNDIVQPTESQQKNNSLNTIETGNNLVELNHINQMETDSYELKDLIIPESLSNENSSNHLVNNLHKTHLEDSLHKYTPRKTVATTNALKDAKKPPCLSGVDSSSAAATEKMRNSKSLIEESCVNKSNQNEAGLSNIQTNLNTLPQSSAIITSCNSSKSSSILFASEEANPTNLPTSEISPKSPNPHSASLKRQQRISSVTENENLLRSPNVKVQSPQTKSNIKKGKLTSSAQKRKLLKGTSDKEKLVSAVHENILEEPSTPDISLSSESHSYKGSDSVHFNEFVKGELVKGKSKKRRLCEETIISMVGKKTKKQNSCVESIYETIESVIQEYTLTDQSDNMNDLSSTNSEKTENNDVPIMEHASSDMIVQECEGPEHLKLIDELADNTEKPMKVDLPILDSNNFKVNTQNISNKETTSPQADCFENNAKIKDNFDTINGENVSKVHFGGLFVKNENTVHVKKQIIPISQVDCPLSPDMREDISPLQNLLSDTGNSFEIKTSGDKVVEKSLIPFNTSSLQSDQAQDSVAQVEVYSKPEENFYDDIQCDDNSTFFLGTPFNVPHTPLIVHVKKECQSLSITCGPENDINMTNSTETEHTPSLDIKPNLGKNLLAKTELMDCTKSTDCSLNSAYENEISEKDSKPLSSPLKYSSSEKDIAKNSTDGSQECTSLLRRSQRQSALKSRKASSDSNISPQKPLDSADDLNKVETPSILEAAFVKDVSETESVGNLVIADDIDSPCEDDLSDHSTTSKLIINQRKNGIKLPPQKKTGKQKKLKKKKPAAKSKDRVSIEDPVGSVASAFHQVDQMQFDDRHAKLNIHHLVSAFINPANVPDVPTATYLIIEYLANSRRNPMLSFSNTKNPSVFLPLAEECVATAVFEICRKKKPHLQGLLDTVLKTLRSLVLAKETLSVYGQAALARVYAELCRRQSDDEKILMFCADLLIWKNKNAPFLIASIVSVCKNLFADNLSDETRTLFAVIKYAISKKPAHMLESHWKLSCTVLKIYLTVEPVENIIEATTSLLMQMKKQCMKGSEVDYKLLSSVNVISTIQGWKWTSDNILFDNVIPCISRFGIESHSSHFCSQSFRTYINLYVDCCRYSDSSCSPSSLCNPILPFTDSSDESISDSAKFAILKFYLFKQLPLTNELVQFIEEKQEHPMAPPVVSLIKLRYMSEQDTLSMQDIIQ